MRETNAGEAPSGSPEEPRASLRVRVGVGAAIVLVVGALVASVLITALTPVGATTVVGPSAPPPSGASVSPAAVQDAAVTSAPTAGAASHGSAPEAASAGSPAPGLSAPSPPLMVHVLGAVAHPGVFALVTGARVVDAVAAAGGFTDTAEQGSVNLARPLADGEQLRVLAVGEPPPAAAPAGSTGSSDAGRADGSGAPGASDGSTTGGASTAPAVIDLNAATALDLDTLPRIGPAMAERIISWRTANGPFQSIDDLLQITGIGDKTFAALRDLVTV